MIFDRWRKIVDWGVASLQSDAPAKTPPPQTLMKFLLWAVQGAGWAIGLMVLLSLGHGATEVLAAWALGQVVDAVATSTLSDQIGVMILGILLLVVARPFFFSSGAFFQSVVLGPGLFTQVMQRLFRHSVGQSVTFFDNDFAGRIAQKQLQTAGAVAQAVTEACGPILFGVASVVSAIALMATISPTLMIVVLVWFSAYLVYLRFTIPYVRSRAGARAEARSQVTGQVVDTITNIKTVKLFAQADFEDRQAITAMRHLHKTQGDYGEVTVLFRLGLMLIAGLLPISLLGIALTLDGVSAGEIAAMGTVSFRLAQMTGFISFTLMGIYAHIGEIEDGIRTLSKTHTLVDRDGAAPLKVADGVIAFENVSFNYGGETHGLRNINLTMKSGERLGIVGASGAGKSTLVSLLLRLYDAEAGRVLIDGQDVRSVQQESLRSSIGMVTQETAMFSRSARDNVAYGNPSANMKNIEVATQAAEAYDFISELKDNNGRTGFDAHLGERGVKLSGGQRQRIALARAILKDAPILILDEATSALDSEVEASIQIALGRAMKGKTVVAIAHRLSTIADMDRIIVLDKGQIVEEGTHDELLAKNGTYFRFWNRQSGGFVNTKDAAE